MAKPNLYIVVHLVGKRELKTYWTDHDAPEGRPKAVSRKEALQALKSARSIFPHNKYALKKVVPSV